jgi:hypothetical protein
MKKLICLFLMLWLPLFMGSAWAMSMRMQLDNAGKTQVTKSSMSCHEVSDKTDKNRSTNSNQCAVCGMCALVNGTANFNTAPVLNFATSQFTAPQFFYVAFTSQEYPPSYKPPIFI